jgi:8-hydroxy-5-deazaflavin:NADPH oxidoreductase
MDVTIVGAGSMARGIAIRLLAGGNGVRLLVRTPNKAVAFAEQLRGETARTAHVQVGSPGDPLIDDIVVLAIPYSEAGPLVLSYGEQLAGKIVVDISNPLNDTYDGLVTPPDSSAAEELARVAPPDARVVKAFNTTFAGSLVAGKVAGQPLDVFLAGDDVQAKTAVAQLVEAGGLRAIDAGPLEHARQLEALGFLHIALQGTLGTGFQSAIKILS